MSRWRWMFNLRLVIEWAGAVNAELTRLHWSVGQRLASDVLGGERPLRTTFEEFLLPDRY